MVTFFGEIFRRTGRSSVFDKRIKEARVQVSAGLEACLPMVSVLSPFYNVALQPNIAHKEATCYLKDRFPFQQQSATICDNHGRLQTSRHFFSVRRAVTDFLCRKAIARLVFFLTCTSTRSECTRTGIQEARLARKGDRMSSHSISLFARIAILKGKGQGER